MKELFKASLKRVVTSQVTVCLYCSCTILRVPKKAERRIISTLQAKMSYFFTSLDKTSSAEENDTKIAKFGWVILSLCTLLEIQSFQISLDFWDRCAKNFVGTNNP